MSSLQVPEHNFHTEASNGPGHATKRVINDLEKNNQVLPLAPSLRFFKSLLGRTNGSMWPTKVNALDKPRRLIIKAGLPGCVVLPFYGPVYEPAFASQL